MTRPFSTLVKFTSSLISQGSTLRRLSGRLRTMSTFNLPNIEPPVPVKLPSDLSQDQLLSFAAFKTWLSTLRASLKLQQNQGHPLHQSPYQLRSIEVQACDFFSAERLGFIKFKAEITNDQGEYLPGAVFMRGGSVAMLLILQPDDIDNTDDEYVVLVVQPRIAAGSLGFVELPAGMLDGRGSFTGTAAREIREETDLEIKEDELIDMTRLALECRDGEQYADEQHLQQALYPSPGGCDEFMPVFLARKRLNRKAINEMKGKLTGLREHGEKITLQICRLNDLWKVGARDAKLWLHLQCMKVCGGRRKYDRR